MQPLTTFQIIVIVGSFVAGFFHTLAANGAAFGKQLPPNLLGYLATFGAVIAGFVAFVQNAGSFNGTVAFYAIFQGALPALLSGVSTPVVAHVALGARVNAARPAASSPPSSAPPA